MKLSLFEWYGANYLKNKFFEQLKIPRDYFKQTNYPLTTNFEFAATQLVI